MLLDSVSAPTLITVAVILPLILYLIASVINNVILHPLRNIPGPVFSAINTVPMNYHKMRGDYIFWVHRLHLQYGPKVRVAPNEISFISYDAWKDIYGHRVGGKNSFQKYLPFYGKDMYLPEGQGGIMRSQNDADHGRHRRLCSAAFADKSVREQEPLLRQYVEVLVDKLQGLVGKEGKTTTNLLRWFNFTTFDIMSDLTFGEKMGLLDNSSYTDWVIALIELIKFIVYHQIAMETPIINRIVPLLVPKSTQEKRNKHIRYAADRVDKRLKMKTDRPDIWTHILRFQNSEHNEDRVLNLEEMYSNSSTFMAAGTDTSATLMSGLIFLLLSNPDKKDKLLSEIRGKFATRESINLKGLLELEYLHACLEEALRIYPPLPTGTPRVTPIEGAIVSGEYMPPGTLVYVSHWPAYHSPSNFQRPEEFLPERWLKGSEFAEDDKQVFQPFSFGPRNCIGRNLAYHEMRLILSNVLWSFDLELCNESKDWLDQRAYVFWEKKPLMVRLSKRA